MKQIIFFLFLFISSQLAAQYDTALIRKAFDYIKTEEFKEALKNYMETEISNNIKTYPSIRKRANRYRMEEIDRMNFWLINKCLIPERFYLVPDTTSRKGYNSDSLSYKKFDKYDYKSSYENCDKVILITPRFLNSQTIELEYFSGQNLGIKMGESNILRLRKIANKFELIFRGTIFWN